MEEAWVKWFDQQSEVDKRTIALSAIERLMELEEVSFRVVAPLPASLFWNCSGEEMNIPF